MNKKIVHTKIPLLSSAWHEAIIFGVLWGSLEITLGSFLHVIRMPFAGVFLSIAGACMLITGRTIYPRLGFCIRAGLICVGIKCFGPLGMKVGPLVAILMESILIESTFCLPHPLLSSILSGVLVVAWSFSQQIIIQVVFLGGNVLDLYLALFNKTIAWIGMSEQTGIGIGIGIVFITLWFGALGGFWSYKLGRYAAALYWQNKRL